MRMTSFSAVGIKNVGAKRTLNPPQIEAQRKRVQFGKEEQRSERAPTIILKEKSSEQAIRSLLRRGTPDAIRTHDLQSRSLTLYPAELQARIFEPEYYNASRYESKQFSVPAPPRSPKLPAFGTALRAGGDVISRAVRSVLAPCQRGSRGIRRPVRAA